MFDSRRLLFGVPKSDPEGGKMPNGIAISKSFGEVQFCTGLGGWMFVVMFLLANCVDICFWNGRARRMRFEHALQTATHIDLINRNDSWRASGAPTIPSTKVGGKMEIYLKRLARLEFSQKNCNSLTNTLRWHPRRAKALRGW